MSPTSYRCSTSRCLDGKVTPILVPNQVYWGGYVIRGRVKTYLKIQPKYKYGLIKPGLTIISIQEKEETTSLNVRQYSVHLQIN